MKVAILDTETGGLDRVKHGILSLSVRIVNLSTKTQVDEFYSLVIPSGRHEISPQALEVHGITLEKLESAGVSQTEVDKTALAMLAKHEVSVIIAHNASFDFRFCETRMSREWAKFNWICTRKDISVTKGPHESTMTKHSARSLALRSLAKEYDISVRGAHDASVDTQILWSLIQAAPTVIDQIMSLAKKP